MVAELLLQGLTVVPVRSLFDFVFFFRGSVAAPPRQASLPSRKAHLRGLQAFLEDWREPADCHARGSLSLK